MPATRPPEHPGLDDILASTHDTGDVERNYSGRTFCVPKATPAARGTEIHEDTRGTDTGAFTYMKRLQD